MRHILIAAASAAALLATPALAQGTSGTSATPVMGTSPAGVVGADCPLGSTEPKCREQTGTSGSTGVSGVAVPPGGTTDPRGEGTSAGVRGDPTPKGQGGDNNDAQTPGNASGAGGEREPKR